MPPVLMKQEKLPAFLLPTKSIILNGPPEKGLIAELTKDQTTDIYWGMGPFIDETGNLSDNPKVHGEVYFIEQEKLYKINVNGKKELLDRSLKWQKQIPYNPSQGNFNSYMEYTALTPLKVNQNKVILGETNLGPVIFSTTDNKKLFLKDLVTGSRLKICKATDINDLGDVSLWSIGGNRDGGYYIGAILNKGPSRGGFLPYLINNEGICIALEDANPDFSPGRWVLNVHLKDPWTSIEAVLDINDKGQIVGFGNKKDGKIHALLLNPTTHP